MSIGQPDWKRSISHIIKKKTAKLCELFMIIFTFCSNYVIIVKHEWKCRGL